MVGLAWLPETLAYGGAAAVGQAIFLCSKRRQRYALKFLRQAYPEGKTDRELLALARRATGNCLKFSIDMVKIHSVLRKGTLDQYVEGLDHLQEQLPKGGLMVLTGHLGSWEVGATIIASLRKEAHVIVRDFENPMLRDFLESSRQSSGLHLHPRRGGIRGLARAMKNGATGLQVVDQNQRLRGVHVPFFGKMASTERGAATLAVRSGYPVAICFCPRVGSGFRFKAKVGKIIYPKVARNGSVAYRAKELVREINAGLEEGILAYPEQYLWAHDRYRTQQIPESAGDEEFDSAEEGGFDRLTTRSETA